MFLSCVPDRRRHGHAWAQGRAHARPPRIALRLSRPYIASLKDRAPNRARHRLHTLYISAGRQRPAGLDALGRTLDRPNSACWAEFSRMRGRGRKTIPSRPKTSRVRAPWGASRNLVQAALWAAPGAAASGRSWRVFVTAGLVAAANGPPCHADGVFREPPCCMRPPLTRICNMRCDKNASWAP